MKNKQAPKDKNERRIQQQQKKQAKVKQGNTASATPQGTGIGSSTQQVVHEKQGPAGNFSLENPFTAVDPEMQRKEAEAQQTGRQPDQGKKRPEHHRHSSKQRAGKPASKTLDNPDKRNRESNEKKEEKEDPAHWKGEGNPGYACANPDQQRKLSEKGEL